MGKIGAADPVVVTGMAECGVGGGGIDFDVLPVFFVDGKHGTREMVPSEHSSHSLWILVGMWADTMDEVAPVVWREVIGPWFARGVTPGVTGKLLLPTYVLRRELVILPVGPFGLGTYAERGNGEEWIMGLGGNFRFSFVGSGRTFVFSPGMHFTCGTVLTFYSSV